MADRGVQCAVVTGSSRGFGVELCRALAATGWDVIGVSRSGGGPDIVGVRLVKADVTGGDLSDLLTAVGAEPVGLVVNNAGAGALWASIETLDPGSLRVPFEVNVVAPLAVCQALLPALRRADAPLVVNVSSRLASSARQAADHYGQAQRRTSYAYRVTKAAQNMLSIALAADLASDGVEVWALHPGRLTTSMGSSDADMSPSAAADRLVQWIAARVPHPGSARFLSLDPREVDDGHDLEW